MYFSTKYKNNVNGQIAQGAIILIDKAISSSKYGKKSKWKNYTVMKKLQNSSNLNIPLFIYVNQGIGSYFTSPTPQCFLSAGWPELKCMDYV